jgi:catechol-2,3-dioxygenase
MTDFYSDVVGLTVTDRGKVGSGDELVFMSADPAEHHQFVLMSGRPKDVGFNVIQQISFLVESLDELRTVWERIVADGRKVERCITHGNAWSVYFLDPEGNRGEVYCHTPWHIPQPHAFPIDLSRPNDEIERVTEEHCRQCDGFMPATARESEMAKMMGLDEPGQPN